MFTDLELRRSCERIREQAQQLEAANAQKDRLFLIVAHDLRNPLSGFLSITDLLHSRLKELDVTTVEEYLGLLKESSEKLNNLLENLLTWARLQSGALTPMVHSLMIRTLLREAADLYRNNAKIKSVRLHLEESEELRAYGDHQMVFTVFRNLVANGIKFSNSGGIVRLGAVRENDDRITVSIADSGVGMDESKGSTLSETGGMYSRRGTAGESGTGLGLLFSHDLLRVQSGDITVESTPGKGSIFRVSLPAADVEKGDAASSHP